MTTKLDGKGQSERVGMKRKALLLTVSCLAGVVIVLAGCTPESLPVPPPLPAGTTLGTSFSFSTGGTIRLAYGPSLRSDQIGRLEQLASTYIPPLTDIFWLPRADLTVLFEVVLRPGGHTNRVVWEYRDRSGILRSAIFKVELNGFGAENDDPFTQGWLPGAFIHEMTQVLQRELPHALVNWFAGGTADATGLILLEEGRNAYPSGLSSFLVDKEWAIPLYLRSYEGWEGRTALYRGWLLLAAYDPSIIRRVNERLYSKGGEVGERQLRQAILAELGNDAILDNITANDWLDRVGFYSGIDTIRDGDYLFWSITEEAGWSPNWLQASSVAKKGTVVKEIEKATYRYRIADAFMERVIVEGEASDVPWVYLDFEPGISDLSVWYLDLTASFGGTSIVRRVVVPHLLSGQDTRKAVVLVDSTYKVIEQDGTLEVKAGNTVVISVIDNGVAYFDTAASPELNRATAIVRLSNGKTASFTNLLSLPDIGRQWVLVLP